MQLRADQLCSVRAVSTAKCLQCVRRSGLLMRTVELGHFKRAISPGITSLVSVFVERELLNVCFSCFSSLSSLLL